MRNDPTKAAAGGARPSKADTARLLHELEVHQVELQMQNEELRRARAELEAALGRYTALFDFAPIGYFTFSADGTVREANLAGARLLGVDRSALPGVRFGEVVAMADRHGFAGFLCDAFGTQGFGACEVALLRPDRADMFVRIEAQRLEGQDECLAAVLDVTDRGRARAEREHLIELLRAASARVEGHGGEDVSTPAGGEPKET